jgi:hypothetical protein
MEKISAQDVGNLCRLFYPEIAGLELPPKPKRMKFAKRKEERDEQNSIRGFEKHSLLQFLRKEPARGQETDCGPQRIHLQ